MSSLDGYDAICYEWHRTWFEYVSSRAVTESHWRWICSNANFLPQFIVEYPQFLNHYIWKRISTLPQVSAAFMEAHPEFPWDWNIQHQGRIWNNVDFLQRHFDQLDQSYMVRRAPLSFILQNFGPAPEPDNFWINLTSNPHLTLRFIERNIERSWNWKWMSLMNYLTPDFLLRYPNQNWDWTWLTKNPVFPLQFILSHLDTLKWDMNALGSLITESHFHQYHGRFSLSSVSSNPNFMDWIQREPDLEWNWHYVSANSKLTFPFVLQHLDKPWNWRFLSWFFSIKTIIDHPELPWTEVHMNSSISVEIIQQHPAYPWIFEDILHNDMSKARENYIQFHYKKWLMRTIETELMERTWHPDRLVWVMDQEQCEHYFITV